MGDRPYESLIDDFFLEARERADRVEELLLEVLAAPGQEQDDALEKSRRELHTLKGNAGMMGFEKLQALVHEMEDVLDGAPADNEAIQRVLGALDRVRASLAEVSGDTSAPPPAPATGLLRAPDSPGEAVVQAGAGLDGTSSSVPATVQRQGRVAVPVQAHETEQKVVSVRVPFEALDGLVELLAEMVIFKNRLADSVARGRRSPEPALAWDGVEQAQEALSKTLSFIQDRVMRLRMVPLQSLFGKLRRVVNDECHRASKEARLIVSGGETPLDKALLEVASEALGHLVRNAVVHGIETPALRRSKGKAAEGAVAVAAETRGNEVVIAVGDDGAGIDFGALAELTVARGLPVPTAGDPYAPLFLPGFSTRDHADLAAGRGMGLAAVRDVVQGVGGRVEVDSRLGVGTVFRICLPLSVSITRAMLLSVDGEDYALPLSAIVESQRLRSGDGHRVNHAEVLRWRGEVLTLLDLGYLFGTTSQVRDHGYVVVLEVDGRHRGLLVDDLMGIREIVVKGLDPLCGSPDGVSGSTVLGDGRVVLILEPRQLFNLTPFVAEGQVTVTIAREA